MNTDINLGDIVYYANGVGSYIVAKVTRICKDKNGITYRGKTLFLSGDNFKFFRPLNGTDSPIGREVLLVPKDVEFFLRMQYGEML